MFRRSRYKAGSALFLSLLLCSLLSGLFLFALEESREAQAQEAHAQPASQVRPPNRRTAFWIWAPPGDARAQVIYFRQPFRLSASPAQALLQIASRTPFTAYVNGVSVLTVTNVSGAQTVDVARLLRRGINALAVECRNAEQRVGMQFALDIRFSDGRQTNLISDGAVLTSRQGAENWPSPTFSGEGWQRARVIRSGDLIAGLPLADTPKPPVAVAPAPQNAAPPAAVRPDAAAGLDYSRIVRIWDIHAGGKPAENPYTRPRKPGERMILTTSVASSADMLLAASAGFTLFQSDSDHLSTDETQPGVWDFTQAQQDMRTLGNMGLDWCYFPHFAFPPKWYNQQVPYTRIQCLEHNQPVEAFSPWEPKFHSYVSRGYAEMAKRLLPSGASSSPGLSAFYLGIHGDYGEAGLLMGARVGHPQQREEWLNRFGNTHNHLGWWCADPLARAAFRKTMLSRYGDLETLNGVWKTQFKTEEEIAYPASPTQGSRRYWLDFVGWYFHAVGGLTDTVCRVARRNFPDTLLMLPMGFADENPRGGNDNSLLPKIAARHGVEVRSTHGGFKPFALSQASMLGRIASACKFYGVPFWTEPPSRINSEQQVARIFAAVSLGSKGYFDWLVNVRDTLPVYYRYGRFMRVEKPVVDVAMLFPSTSHLLRSDVGYPQTFLKGCADLRDLLNYDIVDERMVQDGALEKGGYRLLVMWEGAIMEGLTLSRIKDWVQSGGTLVAYDFGKIETVEGDRAWFNEMLGYAVDLAPASAQVRFVSSGREGVPLRYRIPVGEPGAMSFLMGDWYEPETTGGVSRRWTGASAEARLPVRPGARSYELLIRASAVEQAAQNRREVLVNGQKVGEMTETRERTYRFPIPESVMAGREVATLTLRCETFVPQKTIPNSNDKRPLGVYVTYIQLNALETASPRLEDLDAVEPGLPPGRFETTIDLNRLRTEWARRNGKGWTVFFPARRTQLAGYYEVVRYLTYRLSDLDSSKRDAVAVDNEWDGVYATLFTDKVLYYNPNKSTVSRKIVLPASVTGRQSEGSNVYHLSLEPDSITPIFLHAAPQDVLLQCESFTRLGALKPQTGGAFSPGRGATHVLIPVNGSITTRFLCDAPGVYRVFYRATRRNETAQAEILLNGRPLSPEPGPSTSSAGAGGGTLYAGVVNLTQGIHTLTLRPRPGQDLRADYVILTTDATVAGYRFGHRIPEGR
jgi:hypothetical protein